MIQIKLDFPLALKKNNLQIDLQSRIIHSFTRSFKIYIFNKKKVVFGGGKHFSKNIFGKKKVSVKLFKNQKKRRRYSDTAD